MTTSRLLLAAAAAGFLLAAALHLASFLPLPPALGESLTLALLASAFALLVTVFARIRRAGAPTRLVGRFRIYDWRPLVALIPPPMRWLTMAMLLYAMMNFGLSMLQGGGVTAAVEDGRYFLTAPGAERREVMREEYDAHRRVATRLFSGHLLLFYLVPLVYFRFVDPRLIELSRSPRAPAAAPGSGRESVG